MDPFQRFALEFREYCEGKLHLLTMVTSVVQNSETVGSALSKLFFQSGACPGDYDQINSLPLEIDRLRNCIDSIEEIIEHARKLFIINFNSFDKFLVFNQEICFSYACKMLVSIGPRLQHFSNSPTSEEVINAELFLAMHSPYKFTQEEDLFCYESMPSVVTPSGTNQYSLDTSPVRTRSHAFCTNHLTSVPIKPSADSSHVTIELADIIPLHATTRSRARLGSDMNPLGVVYNNNVVPPPLEEASRARRIGCFDMALMVTSCSLSPGSGSGFKPNPYATRTQASSLANCKLSIERFFTKGTGGRTEYHWSPEKTRMENHTAGGGRERTPSAPRATKGPSSSH